MNTENISINLTIEPDSQITNGKTLNNLLLYFQWYPFILNMIPSDPNDENYKALTNIKDKCEIWEKTLQPEGRSISRNGEYITNPIRINLKAGEYKISTMVRVFTVADFTIIGKGNDTIIRFLKYDFVKEPFEWYEPHQHGRDCVALFACPWETENNPAFKRDNFLILKDLNLRLEDGLWYPVKNPGANNPAFKEYSVGVLLSYVNFHKAEISNLNIVAKDNGEVTLLNGDECDHHIITDCYLYLNNWIDLLAKDDWLHTREQGSNINIRGSHKSALVARNTFIKHGNDEALTFLQGGMEGTTCNTHENIRVINNTFTYLDADPVLSPDIPIIPDVPVTPDVPVLPESSGSDTASSGTTGGEVITGNRPVHTNVVLVSFAPHVADKCRSVWKNVLFAENTLYLEGPVHNAVSMTLVINDHQRDECENVVFANNCFYHSYRHNGKMPGNGGDAYLYSSSFIFQILPTAIDGNSVIPTVHVERTSPVSFYGNSFFYSQHTQDYQSPDYPSYRLAYEHSCFKIVGGCVNIHDNFIDGTKAEVKRLEGADGIFGKSDNPVSLIHCLPCKVDGDYSVRFNNNRANGYGVALRCRGQYDFSPSVAGYTITMESNSLNDGAAIVLHDVDNSQITIVQNRFFNCTGDFFLSKKLTRSSISLCQNFFDSNKSDSDYHGRLFTPNLSSADTVMHLFVMSNCLTGYTNGSLQLPSETKSVELSFIEGNLIASKAGKDAEVPKG